MHNKGQALACNAAGWGNHCNYSYGQSQSRPEPQQLNTQSLRHSSSTQKSLSHSSSAHKAWGTVAQHKKA